VRRPGRDLSWKAFLQGLSSAWSRNHLDAAAGNIAFYALLSIFPFLLFVVALGTVVVDPATIERLVDSLARVAPPAVAELLTARLRALGGSNNIRLLTFGAAAALWTASAAMQALASALDAVFDAPAPRPYWLSRAIALAMVIVSAVFLVVATIATVALGPVLSRLPESLATVVGWLRFPVAMIAMGFVLALLYAVLPNVRRRFRLVTPGSILAVLLWTAASAGFSYYVTRFSKYEVTYGALGGVIVLITWLWISANVVLLGAAVNALLEEPAERTRPERTKRARSFWRKATA
jgi:membrane protein